MRFKNITKIVILESLRMIISRIVPGKHHVCNQRVLLTEVRETSTYLAGGPGELPTNIDSDGFPPIGTRLIPGKSILYVYTHSETMETTAVRYKDGEQIAYVEAVSLNGSWSKVRLLFM